MNLQAANLNDQVGSSNDALPLQFKRLARPLIQYVFVHMSRILLKGDFCAVVGRTF